MDHGAKIPGNSTNNFNNKLDRISTAKTKKNSSNAFLGPFCLARGKKKLASHASKWRPLSLTLAVSIASIRLLQPRSKGESGFKGPF